MGMFGKSRYFGLTGQKLQLAVGLLAGLDFLLFGYDQGVMGGLLTLPSFIHQFPEIDTTEEGLKKAGLKTVEQKNHRATIQGIAVAAYNVGCFCGAVSTIWLGDPLGRRRTIFVGSSIMIFGATLMAAAVNLPMFIVARLITGYVLEANHDLYICIY